MGSIHLHARSRRPSIGTEDRRRGLPAAYREPRPSWGSCGGDQGLGDPGSDLKCLQQMPQPRSGLPGLLEDPSANWDLSSSISQIRCARFIERSMPGSKSAPTLPLQRGWRTHERYLLKTARLPTKHAHPFFTRPSRKPLASPVPTRAIDASPDRRRIERDAYAPIDRLVRADSPSWLRSTRRSISVCCRPRISAGLRLRSAPLPPEGHRLLSRPSARVCAKASTDSRCRSFGPARVLSRDLAPDLEDHIFVVEVELWVSQYRRAQSARIRRSLRANDPLADGGAPDRAQTL